MLLLLLLPCFSDMHHMFRKSPSFTSCSAELISFVLLPADGPAKHWLNRALNNFKGVKGAVSNGAAQNLVWMPIVTCLLYAGLKMAEGNLDDILANCQVAHISFLWGCCPA